jgi:hypothetical protein
MAQVTAKRINAHYLTDLKWYRDAAIAKLTEIKKQTPNPVWIGQVNAHSPIINFSLFETTTRTLIHLNKTSPDIGVLASAEITRLTVEFLRENNIELSFLLRDGLGKSFESAEIRSALPLVHLTTAFFRLLPHLSIHERILREGKQATWWYGEFWGKALAKLPSLAVIITANENIKEPKHRLAGRMNTELFDETNFVLAISELFKHIPRESHALRNRSHEFPDTSIITNNAEH